MFRFIERGLTRSVSGPVHGRQDLGYSPGGAMDGFAMRTGNLLLGNTPDKECLEILLWPPKIEFLSETLLVLCGAAREAVLVSGVRRTLVEHARVYLAGKGDVLALGEVRYGFRTYLCSRDGADADVIGRTRKPFAEVARWPSPDRRIRVVRGPEHRHLNAPEVLLDGAWTVSPQSDDVGLRLNGPALSCALGNIVSEAVTDGTMQLTPSGPIILLRNRPTIGGYPRIFNVISADVDLVAQYGPGTTVFFRETDLQEAVAAARQKQEDIAQFVVSGWTSSRARAVRI